jgi:hypothetical protein
MVFTGCVSAQTPSRVTDAPVLVLTVEVQVVLQSGVHTPLMHDEPAWQEELGHEVMPA